MRIHPSQARRRPLAAVTRPCAVLLLLLLGSLPGAAQQNEPPLDLSRNPEWFPRFYTPFKRQTLAKPLLINVPDHIKLAPDGTMELSLAATLAAAVDNNLDLMAARHDTLIADTDILRAKSGQAPRGVSGAPVPSGLFAAAIGAGVGGAGGGGGGDGTAISGGARSVTIGPIGTFDPSLSVNFSFDRTKTPLNSVRVAGVPVVITRTTAFQTSYQQAFTSGTGVRVSFTANRQNSTQRSLSFNPSLTTNFAVTLTQRLLNGFGFAVNRRFIEVARRNKQIVRESFRQRLIEVVAQAQSAYWDLGGAGESVVNAEQALAAAEQLAADTQARFDVGTVSGLDVTAARAEVAARRRDLVETRVEYQRKELAVKGLVSRDLNPRVALAGVVATDGLPSVLPGAIPSLEHAHALALENRPDLRRAEQSLLNSDVVIRFTRDSLRPTLSAFTQFIGRGLFGDRTIPDPVGGQPTILSGGFRQAFRQARQFDFPAYAVGITLTMPLRNRRALADNFRAQIDRRQDQASLQQLRNQIGLEVRQAITTLEQGQAQVEAASDAARLAEQTLEAERTKLAAGMSVSYDVILAERDLRAARESEIRARADQARALAELNRATGTTLEEAGIDLGEAERLHLVGGAASKPSPK